MNSVLYNSSLNALRRVWMKIKGQMIVGGAQTAPVYTQENLEPAIFDCQLMAQKRHPGASKPMLTRGEPACHFVSQFETLKAHTACSNQIRKVPPDPADEASLRERRSDDTIWMDSRREGRSDEIARLA